MPTSGLFSPSSEDASPADPILDGALAVFADIGIRRATVDDIAKKAGVGRVTVYRKIGGKDQILTAVLFRESQRLFDQVRAAADTADNYTERVVIAFATTVSAVRDSPLWNRILELEPATVLQQLTLEGTPILAGAVAATADVIRGSAKDLDEADLLARAEILVRITHSILLTPRVLLPLETYEDVEKFARTHLMAIAETH